MHHKYMDFAENPAIPNVIHASNRWKLGIKDQNPGCPGLSKSPPETPSHQARSQDRRLKHVRTGCDAVRGKSVSLDRKYVELRGQGGGGVEIWAISAEIRAMSAERGDEWKVTATEERLKGVKDLGVALSQPEARKGVH